MVKKYNNLKKYFDKLNFKNDIILNIKLTAKKFKIKTFTEHEIKFKRKYFLKFIYKYKLSVSKLDEYYNLFITTDIIRNVFILNDKYSEFKASAIGLYIELPFFNFPTGSSPQ